MASQTIKAFAAGATREGLSLCSIPFSAQTGIMIEARTNHGHVIEREVLAGNVGDDIVLLPTAMIDKLAAEGLVDASTRMTLGTIRIGAAVRDGVPTPNVSTKLSLKNSLLLAKSVVLTAAPSGIHMDHLIAEMGLAQNLADRITRYDTGTLVNQHLSASTADDEIGFGVATEILIFRDRGVHYVGPLPDELQMALNYEGAMLTSCLKPDGVRDFFAFLKTEGPQN